MKSLHYLFHFIAYYIAWLACIFLASRGLGLLGSLLVLTVVSIQIYWQFAIRKETRGLFYLIIILTIAGSCIDTILIWCHLIIFRSNPLAPYFTAPWMITIWVSFAVFMFATFSSLLKHYYILGILSFFGFSLAYAIGVEMGAALFPYGYKTCFLIGAAWSILLPLCVHIYKRRII